MNPLLQLFFQLLDQPNSAFAAWEQEMEAVDIPLTSSPWVGWHEEGPSLCG